MFCVFGFYLVIVCALCLRGKLRFLFYVGDMLRVAGLGCLVLVVWCGLGFVGLSCLCGLDLVPLVGCA